MIPRDGGEADTPFELVSVGYFKVTEAIIPGSLAAPNMICLKKMQHLFDEKMNCWKYVPQQYISDLRQEHCIFFSEIVF